MIAPHGYGVMLIEHNGQLIAAEGTWLNFGITFNGHPQQTELDMRLLCSAYRIVSREEALDILMKQVTRTTELPGEQIKLPK